MQWDRNSVVETIIDFVTEHPESYASLAVCRRALDKGLAVITAGTIADLRRHLFEIADEKELAAYRSIVL